MLQYCQKLPQYGLAELNRGHAGKLSENLTINSRIISEATVPITAPIHASVGDSCPVMNGKVIVVSVMRIISSMHMY